MGGGAGVECGPWRTPAGFSVNSSISGNEEAPGPEPSCGAENIGQVYNNQAPVSGQDEGRVKVEALHLLLWAPGDWVLATESEISPEPKSSFAKPRTPSLPA